MLFTGLATDRTRLEKSMLLLHLIDTVHLLTNDAIRAYAVVLGIVAVRTPILHILTTNDIILLV